MARSKLDPEILAHLEWLGFVRPTGLVVSAPALVRAGAILDRRDAEGQRLLRSCVAERVFDAKEGAVAHLSDFRAFAESVLGWSFSPKGYSGTTECPIPPELKVPLPDYGETLRLDFAVRELEPKDGASPWQLLVRVIEAGEDFDRVVRGRGQLEASPHGRMERLLRQTGVPAGLLFNGRALRLVSAPRGESSGWLDFRVGEMIQTAGRPISTALRLLLGQARLLSLPRAQRLAALLDASRKFQNEVSEKLAEQVLHALYELLRGFQAAHDESKSELLREPLAQHPDEVYRALLTVILRLVFLLYAEERDMLPEDETFLRYYSLAGLYERLREDAALFPDTMDQRHGAWAQLLVLFRMIYDGAESGAMRLPKRHGVLFDPDRFAFLEGRPSGGARQVHERIEVPWVPDGTIYRALEKLLVLDGERISYRALDVEQIGSVYETMMGFRLETATGRSVAIKAQKKHGAPTAVDLEALLAELAGKREKWIKDRTDPKVSATIKKVVAAAATVEAWRAHDEVPTIPPDEDEVIFARRLIAQRCIYGVDKNPVAVDLAKMSLWLFTLAKDHALTFVDHALRHGDSLVGLSRKQIEALHWHPASPILKGLGVREPLEAVTTLRKRIRQANESVSDRELRDLWDQAQSELGKVRLLGDLVMAAFFDGEKPKERERKRDGYVSEIVSSGAEQYRGWLEERRHARRPLAPFHWEIEFPEVFAERRGFDAVVGNPPFLGGSKISTSLGASYLAYLLQAHPGTTGNADVVAFFFRTSFDNLRPSGSMGLIATNTITQGDTRRAGLKEIARRGGQIFAAIRRTRWPGLAAVVISVVHVYKGRYEGQRVLNLKPAVTITSYLFPRGGNEDPERLVANRDVVFKGSSPNGAGFVLAESEALTLGLHEQRQRKVILPYLTGEDLYDTPDQSATRFAICFGEMTFEEASRWPLVVKHLEATVRLQRMSNKDPKLRETWWLYERYRPELYRRIVSLHQVLASSRVGEHLSLARVTSRQVFADALNVFTLNSHASFAILQSRPHEIWARFFGSSLEDRLRYTPTDCFETYPFPKNWESDPGLEAAGKVYYEFRSALMVRNNEGLTKTYNRFHDPDESDADILKLRELHAAMDRVVLDAYGWSDIKTDCEFLLDYEIEEDERGNKKKPWRYRWPDEVRDEVLARLIELNAERAKEEARSGAVATKKGRKKVPAKRAPKALGMKDLFS